MLGNQIVIIRKLETSREVKEIFLWDRQCWICGNRFSERFTDWFADWL